MSLVWLPPHHAGKRVAGAWLAVLAALLGSAAWLASTLSGTPLVGYDDANVFFVYARNVLDGHGFVFNAGGERVEGFTSPLWLLICTAAQAITPRFEILLFAINVAGVSAALWWLHRFIGESAFAKASARQAQSGGRGNEFAAA